MLENIAAVRTKAGARASDWHSLAGYGQVILACMLWGTIWVIVKYLNVPFQVIIFYRALFCVLTLAVIFTVRRQWPVTKPTVEKKWLAAVSLAIPFAWLAGFLAMQLNPVTLASLVFNTAPIFTVLLAALILREKSDSKVYIALPVSLVGVVMLVLANATDLLNMQATIIGALFALLAALGQATQVVMMKRGGKHYSGLVIIFYAALVAMVAMAPFALTSGVELTILPLLLMFVLGTVHTIGASGIYIRGVRNVKANHAAILGYIEPATAAALAILIFGEALSAFTLAGGALIILASYIVIRKQTKPNVVS